MEIHRLKPMTPGYDSKLFNKIYEETKGLRKSLTNQIDSRRLGVTKDIIESWFDDKFIFTFNKYYGDKDPDMLKGYIINSLKMFKYRMLRKAYQKEGLFYSSHVELEGETELINIIPHDDEPLVDDTLYNLALAFMKNNLSENAYMLFQAQFNPPPYILQRLNKPTSRISNDLYAEYFGIDHLDEDVIENFFKKLKKEINNTLKSARQYFNNTELAPLAN